MFQNKTKSVAENVATLNELAVIAELRLDVLPTFGEDYSLDFAIADVVEAYENGNITFDLAVELIALTVIEKHIEKGLERQERYGFYFDLGEYSVIHFSHFGVEFYYYPYTQNLVIDSERQYKIS